MKAKLVERRPTPEEIKARSTRKPPPKPKPSKILLAAEKAGWDTHMALLFWKLRNIVPEMAVTLEEHEVDAFNKSIAYTECKPKMVIQAGPRYLVIRATEDVTGDPLQAFESNEMDRRAQEDGKRTQLARSNIRNLINVVRSGIGAGTTSSSDLTALCDAAELISRPV